MVKASSTPSWNERYRKLAVLCFLSCVFDREGTEVPAECTPISLAFISSNSAFILLERVDWLDGGYSLLAILWRGYSDQGGTYLGWASFSGIRDYVPSLTRFVLTDLLDEMGSGPCHEPHSLCALFMHLLSRLFALLHLQGRPGESRWWRWRTNTILEDNYDDIYCWIQNLNATDERLLLWMGESVKMPKGSAVNRVYL